MDAMPLKKVQEKIQQILYNGENFPTLGVKEKQDVRKKIGMLF